MSTLRVAALLSIFATVVGVFAMAANRAVEEKDKGEALLKMRNEGNFKDAYDGYRELVLDPNTDARRVPEYLGFAHECLNNLGRVDEIDAFREEAAKIHAGNWRLLKAVAESYIYFEHHGYIIAGKFERGHRRGGGKLVHATARDRVRALQLFQQAMPLTANDPEKSAVADFYQSFAQALVMGSYSSEAWRLQSKTDLATLPDFEDGWYYGRSTSGAPVNADGTPVYYDVGKSFEDSINDGERWRWALLQVVESDNSRLSAVRMDWARFLQSQFGEQTIAQQFYGWFEAPAEEEGKNDSGTYALHTLGDDETIARLTSGIKRFKLPEDQNYIRVYQQIVGDPKSAQRYDAQAELASIFENRRQYPKAAKEWKKIVDENRPGDQVARDRMAQIVGNWGRFDTAVVQPSSTGAKVDFRYRNGEKVHFVAKKIKFNELLEDVKKYLRGNPNQLDWENLNIQDVGYRLVTKNEGKYLGETAAEWDLELDPRKNHFDRRITVTTPLQKAGAYLLKAEMAGGNTSQIVVWVSDTVLVKKPLSGKSFYFVADALTGKPVPKATVEFFGYRQRMVSNNRFVVDVQRFAEFTDENGQVIVPFKEEADQFTWVVTAQTKKGRFAHLGFMNVWRADYYDQEYNQTKVFTITDRPVYRPKQKVHYKFWVNHAKYDQEGDSAFANRDFTIKVTNPKGEEVDTKVLRADKFGGMEGEYEIPADATLGMYYVSVVDHGGGSFRVEEYKKPEYEVTVDAPKEPVMLGEKVTAKVSAKYYFGSPVTNAKVKYKILRYSHTEHWYPVAPWDWFYGPGYWWFAYDYPWYKGWSHWGCWRPHPWWRPFSPTPPEVVSEMEVPIGLDGTISVDIDTAIAKELHGNSDHRYEITAEVTDQSRRVIVGQGNVLVARQPFKVFAWVDRGHYRAGDTIHAYFDAHTLSQQPVKGKGKLSLLKISYEKNEPVESSVEEWDLDTSDQGTADVQIKAAEAGQYRLSYKVTDAQGHEIEGGYLFSVTGEGFASSDYHFNDIELIPDAREYKPGDTIRLMVNTDRAESTVLLFLRPSNGVYLAPQTLTVKGKSTVYEFKVEQKDMPNLFVEALTIANGKLHSESKEIVIPPEKRVINVAVEPSASEYLPGAQSKIKVTLTDLMGKPFVGSMAMAIYDKSVEYISGGSNVPEIKSFFWQWRRSHYPSGESSLQLYFYNLLRPNDIPMLNLGVFGETAAEEGQTEEALLSTSLDKDQARRSNALESRALGGFGGGGPMAPGSAAPMEEMAKVERSALGDVGGAGGAGQAPLVTPTVRSNFADTAFWAGTINTDEDGVATIDVKMPENLTAWKVRAWGMGSGTRCGEGTSEVVTRKNLIVRLQAPRFFVQKDEVVLSANVHNYLPNTKSVEVTLELEGSTLEPMEELTRRVEIEASGEKRVDWRVKVTAEGQATIRMKALTDEESDAMEMKFPVYVHGMLKTDIVSGAIRQNQNSGKFTMNVPSERRIEQSKFEVRFSPTLAGAMVDALPYMADYPYGCTEQTLNRFLPAVITQKILLSMDLNLKTIRDKRTNLNAQEIGEDVERARQWKRFDRNPVFDEDELRDMVKTSVQRLTEMQLSDGGWGWFSGWGEFSYPHTTAYVVHGLQIAMENDVALVPDMLPRGIAWLKQYQQEELQKLRNFKTKTQPYKEFADNLDAFVYMVLVDAGEPSQEMMDALYKDRVHLSVYAKAMFGLALHKENQNDKLQMIVRNVMQFVVQDEENQTAYLKLPESESWWYWYGSEVEANAYFLKLLSKTDPQGDLASRLVKYLLNNRKHATYWNSTRDSSLAIEALADYLRASGEDKPDMTVEIWFDGEKKKEVRITASELFVFDNKFVLEGAQLEPGSHTVELKRKGKGPLYFNGYLTNFTLEDHITRAGLEVKVNRKLYKLNRVEKTIDVAGSRGQVTKQRVEKFERQEIENLGTLKSGDLVEIELEIDSKNDYEYLLFEDMKAAGFEPVQMQSGYNGNDLGAYVEFRDDRVAFFSRQLLRGKHSVSYRLRAEIPGKFSALPAKAQAMYAPELRANSDEIKVVIED